MRNQIRPCRQALGLSAPASPLYPLSLVVGGVTLTLNVPLGVALGVYAGTIAVAHLVRWLSEPASSEGGGLELLGAEWPRPAVAAQQRYGAGPELPVADEGDLGLLDAEEFPGAVAVQPRRSGSYLDALAAKPATRSYLDVLIAEHRG